MKARGIFQLAVGAALVASTMAAQAVVFGEGLNQIEIVNRENNYRTNENCELLGGCLGPNTGPAGYQLVNPAIGNNVKVGDIFVGIFASRQVDVINTGETVWNADNTQAGGIDTFTGYFVQKVEEIQLNFSGSLDRIILGTADADPFGILSAGEVARAFVDNAGLANTAALLDGPVSLMQSILSVTDGALWASFQVGATVLGTTVDGDGHLHTEVDTAAAGNTNDFNGTFYTAWNLALLGPAYNAGTLTGINDPAENVKGGALLGDPGTTSANNLLGICAPGATFACNDIVGNGQLGPNLNISGSPWIFASEDPLQLYRAAAVPEPGSLALLGVALLGMATARRRRRS